MRIEQEVKLNYDDVLLRPKRSTLGSRKDVSLERVYRFRNSDQHYTGVPVMAANMDGVGTFEMADALMDQFMFTCLVKTYEVNELVSYFDPDDTDLRDIRREHVAYSMGITQRDMDKFMFTCLVKTYEVNELVSYFDPDDTDLRDIRREHVAYSMGITQRDMDKFMTVMELTDGAIKYVCVDVANGYTKFFADFIEQLRNQFSEIVIIAGNVVTGDQTQELILKGADIVKVGIGPGSVCTTRIQTGVGYPQLSAVIECADAAHGLGGHIIADGGCTCPGDVAKAFAGGADFVMLGGMLAGHDQGGGEVITKYYKTNELEPLQKMSGVDYNHEFPKVEEKKFVQFYGMSSKAANDKHFGGLKEYRSSEGREVLVPYRGAVEDTVRDILGGIRSTCTYVGAPSLKQLSKCATFVRTNSQYNRVFA